MAASPSFIKAIFVYSEDGHLALRQAAARGDTHKIKTLLENEKIEDINRCGAHSGKTALHQAAAKGKKETVKLLISLGANPTLKDKSSKSPRELALSTENKTIASLLQLAEYAYEAMQTAKTVFYIPMSQDAIKIFQDFFSKATYIYDTDWERFKNKLDNRNDLIRMLFCQLLEIKAYLEAAREIDYRIGKCGELVRACLAKLLQIEPRLTIAKFNYYNKDAPRNNHTFLVMHLGEAKIIYDANL